MGSCQNAGAVCGHLSVCCSGVKTRSRRGIAFPLSGYREKSVVIHHTGFSLLEAVKVHPLGSLEDTVLLPLLLRRVFQCLQTFR